MRLNEIKQMAKRNIKGLLILAGIYLTYIILINTVTGEQLQWAAIIFLFLLLSSKI
jgi:hypothetical protein